jgi:hypothetical protein
LAHTPIILRGWRRLRRRKVEGDTSSALRCIRDGTRAEMRYSRWETYIVVSPKHQFRNLNNTFLFSLPTTPLAHSTRCGIDVVRWLFIEAPLGSRCEELTSQLCRYADPQRTARRIFTPQYSTPRFGHTAFLGGGLC